MIIMGKNDALCKRSLKLINDDVFVIVVEGSFILMSCFTIINKAQLVYFMMWLAESVTFARIIF